MFSSGFPPPAHAAAPHRRFTGLWYYNAYFRSWDFVYHTTKSTWHVVDYDTEQQRSHCTLLWASRFADAPFDVLLFQNQGIWQPLDALRVQSVQHRGFLLANGYPIPNPGENHG